MSDRGSLLPPEVDPWKEVTLDHLPTNLVRALEDRDWGALKEQLRTVMDSVATESIYGRELFQLVRRLPIGLHRVFDRYRASAAVDYGDWDDLRTCLATGILDAAELEGLRDIWLAPVDCVTAPVAKERHQAVWFEGVESRLQRNSRLFRQWARRMPKLTFTDIVWSREDVPATRHFSYRRIQDAVMLAIAEAHGGSLPLAEALARDAQRFGDDRESLQPLAHDVELLARLAQGAVKDVELHSLRHIADPRGPSPVGTWELLTFLLPFLPLLHTDAFGWSARLVERTAGRIGSPRAILHGVAWRVASELLEERKPTEKDLVALLAQARSAGPGLQVLPYLLHGYVSRRYSSFVDALDLARRSGNVWAEVSALHWMAALDPTPWVTRSLHRLLNVTGWRRPVFVPSQIASDAALALSTAGFRGVAVVEVALLAGRANVTVEIAARNLDDAAAPAPARIAAVQALGKLGTMRSRAILARLLSRRDDLSELARSLLTKPSGDALTDREMEVLELTGQGLTNREIGMRLGLSEHTVARHIANARNKLGAANRAEAVSRLHELHSE